LSGDLVEEITDAIGITDTVTAVKTIAVTVTDPVGIPDAVAVATTIATTVTDPIGIRDAIVEFAAGTVTDLAVAPSVHLRCRRPKCHRHRHHPEAIVGDMTGISCDLTVFVGTQPAVEATFRNEKEDLTDPTAITVITQSPSGILDTYTYPGDAEIAKDTTEEPVGMWVFTFPGALTEIGKWFYKVAGTAGVVAVAEGTISVKKTRL
jgi:hypothetical protein